MKKLTAEKAEELKKKGITHLAAVVQQCMTTRYYNVNSIDDVMKNGGKWIPCGWGHYINGGYGPIGISEGSVDWTHTARTASVLW